MEHRCVECGFRVKTLFVQYSAGNIRLVRCENCKAIADEYIECEFMIVFIDLILHKQKAYRHVLYNLLNKKSVNFEGLLWKSAFGFLLLDAYRILLLKRNEEEWSSSLNASSLVWRCQKMFVDVFVANFLFICIFHLAARALLNMPIQISRDLVLAMVVSSYFKIFLLAMMVWEFPSSVIFIIDMFIFSSNTVALKVITDSTLNRCIGVCFCAHATKMPSYCSILGWHDSVLGSEKMPTGVDPKEAHDEDELKWLIGQIITVHEADL